MCHGRFLFSEMVFGPSADTGGQISAIFPDPLLLLKPCFCERLGVRLRFWASLAETELAPVLGVRARMVGSAEVVPAAPVEVINLVVAVLADCRMLGDKISREVALACI